MEGTLLFSFPRFLWALFAHIYLDTKSKVQLTVIPGSSRSNNEHHSTTIRLSLFREMKVIASLFVTLVVVSTDTTDGFHIPTTLSNNKAKSFHRGHTHTRLYSTLDRPPTQSGDDVATATTTPATPALLVKGMKVGPSIPYTQLTIGVLKESYTGENRVSLAPSNVKMLVDAGLKVVVETGGKDVPCKLIFSLLSICDVQ